LEELQRLRVGMRRAVLAGLQAGVPADQDHRPVGIAGDGPPRLGADGVQPRGDVTERRHEGAVGRAYADVVAVGRDAGKDPGHGVLTDAADREQPRLEVRGGVPVAGREALRNQAHAGRTEQVCGRREQGSAGCLVQELQRTAEGVP